MPSIALFAFSRRPNARGDAAGARFRRVGRVAGDVAGHAIDEAVTAGFAAPLLLPFSGEVELDVPIVTTVVEHSCPSPVAGLETMSLLAEEGIAAGAAAASVWADHPAAIMVVVGLCLARPTHVGVPGAPHHCAPLTRAELDRARPVRASMVAALNPKAWLAFGGGLQGEGGARIVGMHAVAAPMHAPTAEGAFMTIRENARQLTAHYRVPWAAELALKLAAAAMATRPTKASRRTALMFAYAAGELAPTIRRRAPAPRAPTAGGRPPTAPTPAMAAAAAAMARARRGRVRLFDMLKM